MIQYQLNVLLNVKIVNIYKIQHVLIIVQTIMQNQNQVNIVIYHVNIQQLIN